MRIILDYLTLSTGGWLSGKMVREEGKAPEGSRVFIHSQEGKVSNAARPSWNDLASDDRTWNVLDVCKEIAAKHNKTVAQVRFLKSNPVHFRILGRKFPKYWLKNMGRLRMFLYIRKNFTSLKLTYVALEINFPPI